MSRVAVWLCETCKAQLVDGVCQACNTQPIRLRMTPDGLGSLAAAELRRAILKHGPMHSAHEGYAVILEELDELKAEIWKQAPDREQLRKEAIQVAAMALRFVYDVCESNRDTIIDAQAAKIARLEAELAVTRRDLNTVRSGT